MLLCIDQLKVGDNFRFLRGTNNFLVLSVDSFCKILDKRTGNRLNLPVNKSKVILMNKGVDNA